MIKNKFCIMPMMGDGIRFQRKGYNVPKPLIEVNKIPMFLKAARSFNRKSHWIFVIRKNFYNKNFTRLIKDNFKRSKIILLNRKTDGQARTVFKAKKWLNKNSNIYVSSCDLYIEYNKQALKSKLQSNDLIIFIHKPNKFNIQKANNFGWVKIKKNRIVKSACKSKVSSNPKRDWIIIGSFVFKNKKVFDNLLKNLFMSKLKIGNEFYLDSCIEIALKLNLKVSFLKVDKYISWGTPTELSKNYYK